MEESPSSPATSPDAPVRVLLVSGYLGDGGGAERQIAELATGLDPGRYALVFWPPSPFFTRVELVVDLEHGHYHVPLLVSPYGCASYRGS